METKLLMHLRRNHPFNRVRMEFACVDKGTSNQKFRSDHVFTQPRSVAALGQSTPIVSVQSETAGKAAVSHQPVLAVCHKGRGPLQANSGRSLEICESLLASELHCLAFHRAGSIQRRKDGDRAAGVNFAAIRRFLINRRRAAGSASGMADIAP